MDAILRSTIRVTKCLLSYGVVQENVERIILEAFADEVERYPVLYEDNVHSNNGWTVHKNCTFCKIVIPELDSKCFGCSKTVCRFCLKNECCPSCNEFFNKKCMVCKEIPSIPVICHLESCKCKNLYCLTCLRDALGLNLNREEVGKILKACPNCQEKFHVSKRYMRASEIYGVPRYSSEFLDAKHGEISCPRKCGEKMLRVNAQAHLQICPNVKKRFE